ncbi:MAG: hypothetical protein JXB40_02635 [Candidatus Omnitrophica bacterium]|nr:hypothetical protein [Candidatus Omnitrophota bacterium]
MKRYKNYIAATLVFIAVFSAGQGRCSEIKKSVPEQLFYTANQSYESRDYLKAIEGYLGVLEQGLESGNLHYNIGNAFLKMGKLGHSILCYERAKRLIPGDSDLKANLSYANSLVEGGGPGIENNPAMMFLNAVFASYSLREIIFSAAILYFILLALLALFLIRPFFINRFRVVLWIIGILFIVNLAAVGIRYFNERVLKHGIIVQEKVECKYEPIEKSTTYYTLREGAPVLILKTRDGWRRIRRYDGKVGWVKKEAAEEI